MEITKEILISKAIELVNYYQRQTEQLLLEEDSTFVWDLGLLLAKQFLKIMEADLPNIYELRILVKVLDQDFTFLEAVGVIYIGKLKTF